MPDLSEYAKTSEVEELLVPYAKSVDVESELESYALTENVASALAGKVNVVNGKGLSTNDYTTEEKTKLAGIADGAQKNPTLYYCGISCECGSSVYFEKIGNVVTVTYYSGNTISYNVSSQNQVIAQASYANNEAYMKFLPRSGHQAVMTGLAFFSGCSYAHAIINVYPSNNEIRVRINSILDTSGSLYTGTITRLCFSGSYLGYS